MSDIRGRAHKYGDHVDTDVIIPARYMTTSDPAELAKHAMEDLDKEFVNKVRAGDLIVAGRNFGCGSSREHAPIALKTAGVSCIIAASFARIFYRNALNIGLPIVESAEAAQGIADGDEVEVDAEAGIVRDVTSGKEWRFAPLAGIARELLDAGGLVALVKKRTGAG
jgi:3-isopropylmalate/(R)-2-methylmalate dehydratase small subunit